MRRTLSITPPTLDFGTTGVGVPVGPKTFDRDERRARNAHWATTVRDSVKDSTSSVGGASQFGSYTTTCQAAPAPSATCQVVVTHTPTIAGSASAVFTVGDGVVSSPNGTVIGIALAIPTLNVAGTSIDFASTVVGQTSPNVVCTVQNVTATGGGSTPQDSSTITPTVTGDFAIATNNCTASLAPNLSCTLVLTFTPTAKGDRTGMLTVTSTNRGAANTPLDGTGLLPVQIIAHTGGSIVTTTYDFGQVALGGSSAPTTLTLDVYVHAAVGNLAITRTDLKFDTKTAPADFTGSSASVPPCVSVTTTAPTAAVTPYCSMVVVFTPQAKGALTNTIKAAGADGTSSDTVAMQGTGTGPNHHCSIAADLRCGRRWLVQHPSADPHGQEQCLEQRIERPHQPSRAPTLATSLS